MTHDAGGMHDSVPADVAEGGDAAAGRGRRSTDYTSAIYGSIIVTALVVALGDHATSAASVAGSVLATVGVFYLAHVWAAVTSDRIASRSGFARASAIAHARAEWPMLEAATLPVVALLLAEVGVYSTKTGVTVATVIGVLHLAGWGVAVGRRSHEHWFAAIVSGLVNGAFGLAIVGLEVLIH